MQVRLQVAHRKANVRRIVLHGETLIGRSQDCKLRIASERVSRRHCRIIVSEAGVWVRDLGSSNGTYVNGSRIEPETDVPVSPGSGLSLGGVKFRVDFEPPGARDFDTASTAELPVEAVDLAVEPDEETELAALDEPADEDQTAEPGDSARHFLATLPETADQPPVSEDSGSLDDFLQQLDRN